MVPFRFLFFMNYWSKSQPDFEQFGVFESWSFRHSFLFMNPRRTSTSRHRSLHFLRSFAAVPPWRSLRSHVFWDQATAGTDEVLQAASDRTGV